MPTLRSMLPNPDRDRDRAMLPALLLVIVLLAGCIGSPEATIGESADALLPPATDENQTLPDPQVYHGNAVLANPAHFVYCLQNGVDGSLHALDGDTGGWRFGVEPSDAFVVYWFDEGLSYLGGGESEGEVPADAAFAEVCQANGTGPADYTLELIHGDHPDR